MAIQQSSNPITSVAPSSSPITSVPDSYPPSYHSGHGGQQQQQQQLLSRLNLDMRGQRFTVDRETLLNLPESVLLCLFPNGLILNRAQMGWMGEESEDEEEGGLYPVDYDPESFQYILSFWSHAHSRFYGSPGGPPGLYQAQQHLNPNSSGSHFSQYGDQNGDYPAGPGENPLVARQPIIVLREELEYFPIIPSTNPPSALGKIAHPDPGTGKPNAQMLRVKKEVGKALYERGMVFEALQRNVSKEGNLAEQHLIDMLCMSGFTRDDTWGYRSLEPTRTVISSIALVLLKTGITHHPAPNRNQSLDRDDQSKDEESVDEKGVNEDADEDAYVTVDQGQMGTAQKLLLFWRKPARKCWWDGIEVQIPLREGEKEMVPVKVWARRVWTLELSLI